MKYITSKINQWETEGIGSRIQSSISCELIAKSLGLEFYETPVKNLYHNVENLSDDTFCKKYNDFFGYENKNLFFDDVIDINTNSLDELKYLVDSYNDLNKNILFSMELNNTKKILDLNKNILESKNLLSYSNGKDKNEKIIVSIHIRVWNKFDMDFNSIREYYIQNTDTELFYINLIKQIESYIGSENVQFNIFTQNGFTDKKKTIPVDFSKINNSNIKFYIESDIIEMLDTCINSDIFVMSNSSLSYLCYLLRKDITFCKDTFWHSISDDCVRLNNNPIIDNNLSLRQIAIQWRKL